MVLIPAVQPALTNFNFNSILFSEAEANSIMNRPDIKAHLSKFIQESIISEFVESGGWEFSDHFSSNIDYLEYSEEDTFVSLEARIILQYEMKNKQTRYLIDQRYSLMVLCTFRNYWSECLYPFSKYDFIWCHIPNCVTIFIIKRRYKFFMESHNTSL